METIEQKVTRIIAEQMGVDTENVKMESTLAEDLGADSLDMTELFMELESEFDLGQISEEPLEQLTTVQQIVDFIREEKGGD